MPSTCSSSSIVELPFRAFPGLDAEADLEDPPKLSTLSLETEGLDFPGLSRLLRHVSKHAAQDGRPRRSTIGLSPILLPHPEQ